MILLASAIYALILGASLASFLPVHLITHFSNIRSFERAHEYGRSLPLLLVSLLPVGVATKTFIFTPSLGDAEPSIGPKALSEGYKHFDPASATLGETVWYNVWGGLSRRSKVVASRTSILALLTAVHTVLQTVLTVEGADPAGALGWAGVWVAASVATGTMFWWVGGVEGV